MYRILFVLIIFFENTLSVKCQSIINTSNISHDLDSAVSIILDCNGNFSRGNSNVNDISCSGGLGFSLSKSSSVWLIAGFNALRANYEEVQSANFAHLRYNYEVLPKFTINIFGQIQSNKILQIDYRELIGVNFDYDLDHTDNNTIALGIFHELEKYSDNSSANLWRINIVANSEVLLGKAKLVGYVYYQPKADYIRDFRLIGELSSRIPITEYIQFTFNVVSRFDSRPIISVKNWDVGSNVGVRLEFNRS